MKINAIQSYYNVQTFTATEKSKEQTPVQNKKISNNTMIYGLAGVAAVGLATFAILKGKTSAVKSTVKQVEKKSEEIIQSTEKIAHEKPVNLEGSGKLKTEDLKACDVKPEQQELVQQNLKVDAEIIPDSKPIPEPELNSEKNLPLLEKEEPKTQKTLSNVEIKHYSTLGIGKTEPFNWDEKLFYIDNGDGTGKTSQRFYHKDKMYECNIYEEVMGENPDVVKHTRYNFAYDNGRLVGVAKQDLYKDGHQHGVYKDGILEPFPVQVRYKGDKEYKDVKVYTSDALYEFDKRFNPYNL